MAVAEEHSFSQGALRLGLSQPTLMRQINEIEAMLQVRLLERSRNGVLLTPPGEEFLQRARYLLERHHRMLAELRASIVRRVRIGYITPSLFGPVGEALAKIRKRAPGTAFELVEAPPGRQIQLLCEGRIEVGFVGHCQGEAPPGVRLVPLYKVPLDVVLPKGHRLAGRPALALSELTSETFLGLKEELFPGRQAIVAETCQAAGLEIVYRELADSLISLLTLIGHGQGVSLVPSHSDAITHPGTVFIPLLDRPQPHIVFHAALRDGIGVCSEVDELLEACRVEGESHRDESSGRLEVERRVDEPLL